MKGQVRHFFAAFGYSLQGIASALRSEIAFRQECAVLVLMAVPAFLLFSPAVALGLMAAWLFVMALEVLNMAVEALSNLISEEFHPLIKKAKDGGSAAVFLGIVANGALWLAALLHRYPQ